MTDYADQIAAQLLHPTPPQIPVAEVLRLMASAAREGYAMGLQVH